MNTKTDLADWPEKSRELSQLLARAGLGDRAAFARLYERTSGHLFAVLLRIQRDRAQAEDLLQEVYVAVWKAAASFDAARSQPLLPIRCRSAGPRLCFVGLMAFAARSFDRTAPLPAPRVRDRQASGRPGR